jgi:periplasmic copper chaperone A
MTKFNTLSDAFIIEGEVGMKRLSSLLLLVAILTLIGCTPSGGSGDLDVEDVWGRSSPNVAQNGAFYMVITNNSAQNEQLLGAETEACGSVELHEMYMKENDVMGMRQVPGGIIEIPAGESVELKVGGLHVMCIGKQAAFNVGDTIPIKLQFANAGEMEVTADIRDSAMEGMDMGG